MPLSCRFYAQKYPDVDDVVMIKIRSLTSNGAYVQLREYNDIEGMILLSEVSRRRIRSINKLVRIGNTEPAVVIRVDKEKGYIDLSKRRVSKEDAVTCMEKFSKGKAVNSIMCRVGSLLEYVTDEEIEELYKKTAWHFEEKYKMKAYSYNVFKQAVVNPSVLSECDLDERTLSVLFDQICSKLQLQAVKIRSDIKVSCFEYEGIEAVKKALRTGLKLSTEDIAIKINLIAPPTYVITTQTTEKSLGLARMDEALKAIRESITASGGEIIISKPPTVVTAIEEADLAEQLEMAEMENRQVAGDDDDDEIGMGGADDDDDDDDDKILENGDRDDQDDDNDEEEEEEEEAAA